MNYITLIIEVLRSVPKIVELIKSIWNSVLEMRNKQRIADAKKANNQGETGVVEEKLGNSDARGPSGIPGSVVRNKS